MPSCRALTVLPFILFKMTKKYITYTKNVKTENLSLNTDDPRGKYIEILRVHAVKISKITCLYVEDI